MMFAKRDDDESVVESELLLVCIVGIPNRVYIRNYYIYTELLPTFVLILEAVYIIHRWK